MTENQLQQYDSQLEKRMPQSHQDSSMALDFGLQSSFFAIARNQD